jgi:hypothetical protein
VVEVSHCIHNLVSDVHGYCEPAAVICFLNGSGIVSSLCRKVAEEFGLVEGLDYQHVCVGLAFAEMIKTLNGTAPPNFPECDVAASAVTVFKERKEGGIEFTDPIYHDKLLAMVTGRIQKRGTWAFLQPLHWSVWLAALATMFAIPFFVFFFEYVVAGRCALNFANFCMLAGLAHLRD